MVHEHLDKQKLAANKSKFLYKLTLPFLIYFNFLKFNPLHSSKKNEGERNKREKKGIFIPHTH